MNGFSDHFSKTAAAYASYRPDYPPELVAWIAAQAPACARAWDCATGNGQAARLLAAHFREVVATDASSAQLHEATPLRNVTYAVARAEQSGLPDASCDLVTVAQALHWFDLSRFYAEAKRVLKPRGVLAVWSYSHVHVDAAIDPVVNDFYGNRVGRFWPPERKHVDAHYRDLPFPFDEIPAQEWEIRETFQRDQFVGYVTTWSAVKQAREQTGRDPLPDFAAALARVWPDQESRTVAWPVALRVGRRPAG
jgi:ubiquinone/menaquinone biosynthesis C-methylase UbiE